MVVLDLRISESMKGILITLIKLFYNTGMEIIGMLELMVLYCHYTKIARCGEAVLRSQMISCSEDTTKT